MNKFAERLKILRCKKHYTQKELAKELSVSQGAISRWENGQHEPPLIVLVKTAKYFQVTIDYLIGLTDD